MSQIYLHIAKRLQDFPTDDEKISYIRSYLRGTAQQVPIPHWDGNWELFVQELATNFGPHNPFGDMQISLEILSLKSGNWLEIGWLHTSSSLTPMRL
jgi:hypothetical protein